MQFMIFGSNFPSFVPGLIGIPLFSNYSYQDFLKVPRFQRLKRLSRTLPGPGVGSIPMGRFIPLSSV